MTEALSQWENKQKEQFDRIADEYEAHYGDACSRRYREEFLYRPLTENLNLKGKTVLEAMCGGGMMTQFLLDQGAAVTGLDISESTVDSFRKKYPQCGVKCASLFKSGFADNSFDCVAVIGGLHHLHPDLGRGIDEIHRVLKPGGYFLFAEPHAGSIPDIFRKIWYKFDRYFEKNEASIDLKRLGEENAPRFDFVKTRYLGNVAFLLVMQSLAFRMPLRWKRFYTPILMPIESAINSIAGKRLSCIAIGQWMKK